MKQFLVGLSLILSLSALAGEACKREVLAHDGFSNLGLESEEEIVEKACSSQFNIECAADLVKFSHTAVKMLGAKKVCNLTSEHTEEFKIFYKKMSYALPPNHQHFNNIFSSKADKYVEIFTKYPNISFDCLMENNSPWKLLQDIVDSCHAVATKTDSPFNYKEIADLTPAEIATVIDRLTQLTQEVTRADYSVTEEKIEVQGNTFWNFHYWIQAKALYINPSNINQVDFEKMINILEEKNIIKKNY
jgi:hypothetical protein